MSTVAYRETALSWSPTQRGDRAFVLLTVMVLGLLLGFALVLSSIEVPEEPREVRLVPQRIVQFVAQRPRPKPEPPRQEPVRAKPLPEPEPIEEVKPEVTPPPPEVSVQPTREQEELPPLTEAQQQARARVQNRGLLGERQGFAELLDTSDINAMVTENAGPQGSDAAVRAATVDTSGLMANAGQGSGGVQRQAQDVSLGERRLAAQDSEISNIPAFVVNEKGDNEQTTHQGSAREEEDVKVVFDQHKSTLHTLYNRERRKHPGLKGRIVLELTIDATGKVVAVKIVSSELGHEALERRLGARVKQFDFGSSPLGTVTVVYPIEFLPS